MTSSAPQKTVGIIGTGSLACIFAARLSKVANVKMIGSWQDQIESINRSGITILNLDGTRNSFAASAISHLQIPASFRADYVIVLVKSHQTPAAIERIRAVAKPQTVILTLQNGLGNIEQITAALPSHFTSAGITMQGGNITEPATVAHAGNGATVIDDLPQLSDLYELFNNAKIPTQYPHQAAASSMSEVIWRKLIINTAINPITALLGQRNGYLVEDKVARSLSHATAIETAQVAVAEGIWPSSSIRAVEASAQKTALDAARITSNNRSSMLQDISRGNRTEIASICGEVVSRARTHGHPAPLNQLWLQLIQNEENNTTGSNAEIIYSVEELANLSSTKSNRVPTSDT